MVAETAKKILQKHGINCPVKNGEYEKVVLIYVDDLYDKTTEKIIEVLTSNGFQFGMRVTSIFPFGEYKYLSFFKKNKLIKTKF